MLPTSNFEVTDAALKSSRLMSDVCALGVLSLPYEMSSITTDISRGNPFFHSCLRWISHMTYMSHPIMHFLSYHSLSSIIIIAYARPQKINSPLTYPAVSGYASGRVRARTVWDARSRIRKGWTTLFWRSAANVIILFFLSYWTHDRSMAAS